MASDLLSAMFGLNERDPGSTPKAEVQLPLLTKPEEIVQHDSTAILMPHKTASTHPHATARKDSPEIRRPRKLSDASHSSGQRLQPSVRIINGKRAQVRSPSTSSSEPSLAPKSKPAVDRKAPKSPATHNTTPVKAASVPEKPEFIPRLYRIFEEQQSLNVPVSVAAKVRPSSSSSTSSSRKALRDTNRSPKFHHRVSSPLRRQSRVNLTSPSVLSVLSSFTAATSSSSGSNTTVTAKSVASSADIPTMKPRKPVATKMVPPAVERGQAVHKKFNVFNYLDTDAGNVGQEGHEWDSETSASSSDVEYDEYFENHHSRTTSNTSPMSSPDLYRTFWKPAPWDGRQSVYSDSGISMGEDSPTLPRQPLRVTKPAGSSLPRMPPSQAPHAVPGSFPPDPIPNVHIKKPAPSVQPKSYPSPFRMPAQRQQSAPVSPQNIATQLPQPPKDTRSPQTGYGLLATELSLRHSTVPPNSDQPLPLYRRFESLNHRILLHLQDELAELEEQLEHLDSMIFQQLQDAGCTVHTASRRGEARHGGVLHFQRTDIMGQIFLKLNQYNQLLASYRACDQIEGASAKDVSSYKAWMLKNSPVVASETRFLDRDSDLVRVSAVRRPDVSWYVFHLTQPTTATAKLFYLAVGFCAMGMFAIPSLAGRILVLVLLGLVVGGFHVYRVFFDND